MLCVPSKAIENVTTPVLESIPKIDHRKSFKILTDRSEGYINSKEMYFE